MNIEMPYAPRFIVQRAPHKFGGNQERYLQRSKEVVKAAAAKIQQAVAERKDLKLLFMELFEDFRSARLSIALEPFSATRAPAECLAFGNRRDQEGKKAVYVTVLDGEYAQKGQELLRFFHERLNDMGKSLTKNGGAPKKKEWLDQCEGVETAFELEIFEGEHLQQNGWIRPILVTEFPQDFPFALLDKKDQITADENRKLKAAYASLKKTHRDLYWRTKLVKCFEELNKEFPSPTQGGTEAYRKSFFAFGKAKIKIDEKVYVTSHYLTWLYRDFVEDPYDRMLRCSKVMVIHTDNFLIDDLLQECARIFEQALTSPDASTLKRNLKLFTFIFAHTMATERGDAAKNEWYKLAISLAKKMNCRLNPDSVGDLDAITHPLYSRFSPVFDQDVQINRTDLPIIEQPAYNYITH